MHSPLAEVEAALCEWFGGSPLRASVSFVGVDPIEVLRFEPEPGEHAYLSLGMSRYPMTAADSLTTQPDGPRAELLLQLRDPTGHWTQSWRQLAVLAAAPAVEGVVYVPDMTVDLGQPLCPGSRCTGAVVVTSELPSVRTVAGEVSVLQLLPATAAELAWCRVHGASALRQRWQQQSIDPADLGRLPAELG